MVIILRVIMTCAQRKRLSFFSLYCNWIFCVIPDTPVCLEIIIHLLKPNSSPLYVHYSAEMASQEQTLLLHVLMILSPFELLF